MKVMTTLIVKCYKEKQLYSNQSGFRIISFRPSENCNTTGLSLSSYGNFTISGTNLDNIVAKKEYTFDIEPKKNDKYGNSYVIKNVVGVTSSMGSVEVDPEQEFVILSRYMTDKQASNVHEAYPNFIQIILNNQEDTLDFKKIKNVGKKRLASYIIKIKQDCRTILLSAVLGKYRLLSDAIVISIASVFNTPEELEQAIKNDPYYVYTQVAGMSFDKADEIILELFPELEHDDSRCKYKIMDLLQQNEEEGNTVINANVLCNLLDLSGFDYFRDWYGAIIKSAPELHFDKELFQVALIKTYEAEQRIAKAIADKLKTSYNMHMDWHQFTNVDGFECTEEQVKILELANTSNVAMLIGGAGTGKTSSTKALIKMLEHYNHGYTLLAPTGIAAKRLAESTGRKASTIHMFIARRKTADEYCIIDECSMVGIELLDKLLKDHVLPSSKLILVCDQSQLPSISCGNIVQDLIDSDVVPKAVLTKVFRYGVGGIDTVATDVRYGKPVDFTATYDDCFFKPCGTDIVETVACLYGNLLTTYSKDDIMIIDPYNVGLNGANKINEVIQARFNSNDYIDNIEAKRGKNTIHFKIGDKVLNTVNNYDAVMCGTDGLPLSNEDDDDIVTTAIMNGDFGYIRGYGFTSNDNAPFLIVEFDNRLIMFTGPEINNLNLGYAMSIHKSQGSQAKVVIIIALPEHKRNLNRNIEYVGVSRARECCYIVADPKVFNDALKIEANRNRDTALQHLLTLAMQNPPSMDYLDKEMLEGGAIF